MAQMMQEEQADDTDVLVLIPGDNELHVVDPAGYGTLVAVGEALVTCSARTSAISAQVGGVAWPLGPSVPTLRASDYAYSFAPPLESGAYYCLVLAPGTPADAIDLLQHVLASCCAYHGQQPSAPHGPAAARGAPSADWAPEPAAAGPQAQGKADKVAAGIRDGGQLAGRAILAAAAWAAAGLHKGSHAAVARMKPADKPTEVSPLTQERLERAHAVASRTAQVSGVVVETVMSATAHVAGAIATRIASTSYGSQLSQGPLAQSFRKVSVASVDAAEVVYSSLADAARIVLAQTHASTTHVVGHRYGAGAAAAAAAGMGVVTGAAETGLNVYKVRPTALARKVIKDTVKESVLGPREGAPAGSGSGDLDPSRSSPAVVAGAGAARLPAVAAPASAGAGFSGGAGWAASSSSASTGNVAGPYSSGSNLGGCEAAVVGTPVAVVAGAPAIGRPAAGAGVTPPGSGHMSPYPVVPRMPHAYEPIQGGGGYYPTVPKA